jgi:hypothetical protein
MTVMSHKIMNIITKYQLPEMSCILLHYVCFMLLPPTRLKKNDSDFCKIYCVRLKIEKKLLES